MRQRNEDGTLPPLAHIRFEKAPLWRQAAILAMAEDADSPLFTTTQKVAIADNVIDHLKDGFKLKDCFDPLDAGFLKKPITQRFQNIAIAAIRPLMTNLDRIAELEG